MMVQIAVPQEPVVDMRAFVVDSLAGAVDLAEAWLVKRGHCSSLATARELARRMRRLNQ
jgi:hypothetical protein